MKTMLSIGALTLCIATASAEVTSQDLLNAVDKMTPAEAQSFSQKLEGKLWKPVPEGFFSRMAVDISTYGRSIDSVDLSSVASSGGEPNLDSISGGAVGLLWRAFDARCRLGMRFETWTATDSNLSDGGYSRADAEGGSAMLVGNYQWVRRDTWLLWTEVGVGGGSAQLETIDTPAGQGTTLRIFDKSYSELALEGGVAWRFNPVASLFGSGGYQFAESVKLEEGGKNSAITLDTGGPFVRIGLGFNF